MNCHVTNGISFYGFLSVPSVRHSLKNVLFWREIEQTPRTQILTIDGCWRVGGGLWVMSNELLTKIYPLGAKFKKMSFDQNS